MMYYYSIKDWQHDLLRVMTEGLKIFEKTSLNPVEKENKKETNCHNCGAPLKRYKNKCEYCGTEY